MLEWFDSYDLVLALDTGHLRQLRQLARGPQDVAKIRLLRDPTIRRGCGTSAVDVPDPYYGNDSDFEHTLELIEAAMPRLIRDIRAALAEEPEDADYAEDSLDEDPLEEDGEAPAAVDVEDRRGQLGGASGAPASCTGARRAAAVEARRSGRTRARTPR